jgi:hypothetical protein
MDRLTYRLIAASAVSRAGDGTFGLLRRLAEAGELVDSRILSVDAPSSAVTRLLESDFSNQAFTFPARCWTTLVRPDRDAGIPVFLAACRTGIFGRALEGSFAAGRY